MNYNISCQNLGKKPAGVTSLLKILLPINSHQVHEDFPEDIRAGLISLHARCFNLLKYITSGRHMKRLSFLLVLFLVFFSSTSYGFRLGDSVSSIDVKYRGTFLAQEVDYFGDPPRAGAMIFNTKGLFGAAPKDNPSVQQFFTGIRDMLPRDYILTSAYQNKSNYTKEIYLFKSSSLKNVPGIRSYYRYQKDDVFHHPGDPPGTFMVIINYDINDPQRIASCHIGLGIPHTDLTNMKKVKKNPFK